MEAPQNGLVRKKMYENGFYPHWTEGSRVIEKHFRAAGFQPKALSEWEAEMTSQCPSINRGFLDGHSLAFFGDSSVQISYGYPKAD
jgi:hypothetical protein